MLSSLHKIVVLFQQPVARLAGLAQHDLLIHAVVRAVAVAIDDADARARPQRASQIAHQHHRVGDFVIGLQQKHGIDAVGRQLGIVRACRESS